MSSTHLLARIPIFAGFPFDEIDRMLAALDVVRLKAGDVLFYEGDSSEHLFIVVSGVLDIILAFNTANESVVNTLEEGDWLGEISLFVTEGRRTASARARGEVVLFRMGRGQFIQLLQRNPESALITYRDLAEKDRKLQQIYIEKELLDQELKVAADIQKSILPGIFPVHDKFDFGGRILPARQVGGDFYDCFYLDDNRICVLIGDVADKGIPSAIFMARVHALLIAEAESVNSPGDTLRMVNKHITHLEKSAQFVTALYGVLNTETAEFSYARAGHEPPLLLTPQGRIQRLPYKPGMALGLWEDIVLDEYSLFLPKGSLLVMFTDGMTDCRNPKGEPFGLERINRTLAESKVLSAQVSCDELLTRLISYQNGSKQDDDVTLLAVHAK